MELPLTVKLVVALANAPIQPVHMTSTCNHVLKKQDIPLFRLLQLAAPQTLITVIKNQTGHALAKMLLTHLGNRPPVTTLAQLLIRSKLCPAQLGKWLKATPVAWLAACTVSTNATHPLAVAPLTPAPMPAPRKRPLELMASQV